MTNDTKAPERIWVDYSDHTETYAEVSDDPFGGTEYVRADLATEALERVRREAVEQEREAAAQWLFDSAAEDECPPELAKLLFHEADGIKRGLHAIRAGGDDE